MYVIYYRSDAVRENTIASLQSAGSHVSCIEQIYDEGTPYCPEKCTVN